MSIIAYFFIKNIFLNIFKNIFLNIFKNALIHINMNLIYALTGLALRASTVAQNTRSVKAAANPVEPPDRRSKYYI